MVLSIPVQDGREGILYGAISAGPWIEQGTEGVAEYGIVHYIPQARHRDFQSAAVNLRSYTLARLRKSEEVLEGLAKELATLYGRVYEDKIQTQASADIVSDLKSLGQVSTVHDFLKKLPRMLAKLRQRYDIGPVAVYQRQDGSVKGRRVLTLLARTEDETPLPESLPVSATDSSESHCRKHLKARLAACLPGFRMLSPVEEEADEFVVFCIPAESDVSERTHAVLLQFALEVERISASLRSLNAAEQRRGTLEVFIDRAKHALASPLQGVSDRVLQLDDALRKHELRPATARPLVTDLLDFTRDASNVVHRFMSRTRVVAIGTQCHFAPCDVARIVFESVRKLKQFANRRSITIDLTNRGILPDVEGDQSDLAEVFDNLVENAVKFAHDNTEIQILGCKSDDAESWTLPCPGLRFIVEDRGLGIPEEARERIFQLYERGGVQPRGRVIRGTGLGLYICREIVDAHRGAITFRCTSRRVSCPEALNDCDVAFQVDLPLNVVKDQEW